MILCSMQGPALWGTEHDPQGKEGDFPTHQIWTSVFKFENDGATVRTFMGTVSPDWLLVAKDETQHFPKPPLKGYCKVDGEPHVPRPHHRWGLGSGLILTSNLDGSYDHAGSGHSGFQDKSSKYICIHKRKSEIYSLMPESLQPHGLYSP